MKKSPVLVVALLSTVLVGCGNNRIDPFKEITKFNDEVCMHTEAQETFFDYDGDYKDLTTDQIKSLFKVDGNSNLSEPKGLDIAFSYEGALENISKYQLEFALDKKFTDPMVFEAGADAKSIHAENLYIASNYFYRLRAIDEDGNEDLSNVYELKTAAHGIRNLTVGGMTNCRDMGGKMTADGGYVKQGLLYRTAALDDSQSGSIINDEGRKVMMDVMKVKTEIELRGGPTGTGGEASKTDGSRLGDSINYQYIPFAYENGKNLLFRNIEPVRKAFDVLGEPENYPIFFHCRIGTDRTGLIGLLVNAILGVSEDEIFQDYLFSDFGKIKTIRAVGMAGDDSIAGYVAQLGEFPGETLQNKAYNFLVNAGVPSYKLDNIIELLTENGDASLYNNETDKYVVVGSSSLVKEGATNQTYNTTREPVSAARLTAAGNKVTYTFTNDKAFESDLYANLTSKNTSSNLAASLKVTLNGQELTVESTSFATKQLGFDSKMDCWIPSKLTRLNVPQASESNPNVLTIEAKTATEIRLSQICFSGMNVAAKIVKAA